jgi:hypothetical protein
MGGSITGLTSRKSHSPLPTPSAPSGIGGIIRSRPICIMCHLRSSLTVINHRSHHCRGTIGGGLPMVQGEEDGSRSLTSLSWTERRLTEILRWVAPESVSITC